MKQLKRAAIISGFSGILVFSIGLFIDSARSTPLAIIGIVLVVLCLMFDELSRTA